MFAFFRNRRRRRILASRSIPETVWAPLAARTPALAQLDAAAQLRLRDLALLFLHEKRIIGAGGLQVDEAMRVRIAARACLPILELGLDAYRDFVSVIVYPAEFVARGREHVDEDGVVHVGDHVLSGESWDRGPVVLGWRDVEASGRGDGYNVVAHELAHKLDLLDGAVNGIPPLHAGMRVAQWTAAFRDAYDDFVARLERGERTWLDPYAAENPGEFFAVCTEMFFDVPDELAAEYPALYAQLAEFFKQDPARG
ncbi:MAG TPA: M90 family metallopeptidase [Gammaproteobacteria bacterium]|nr:M90 family metallopeptidase [Gammaproteobacteria bacterium]